MSGGGCHHLLLFLSLVNNVTHFATIFVCEPSFLFGLWLEAVSKRDFPLNSAHWTSTSPFSELTFFEIQFFLGRAKFKEKWHSVNIKVFSWPGSPIHKMLPCGFLYRWHGLKDEGKQHSCVLPIFIRENTINMMSTLMDTLQLEYTSSAWIYCSCKGAVLVAFVDWDWKDSRGASGRCYAYFSAYNSWESYHKGLQFLSVTKTKGHKESERKTLSPLSISRIERASETA